MEVDPRLQLSDLTDYQFQSSLAQYHGDTYTNTNHSNTYLQPLSPDAIRRLPRTPNRSSYVASASVSNLTGQPPGGVPQSPYDGIDLSALYQRTSIPSSAQGFNPGRTTSSRSDHDVGPLPNRSATAPTSIIQSDPFEVKDPTIFVPPHLLAPLKTNPPSLREWRSKFFNIDEPLLLTAEQYLTYFPHVDNIYSHRSTQKYKRKPFVSHYWDCRLKGRPTGTPMNKNKKSDETEQEKKKRKRKVRERDLCDVKIKVTEFFSTQELEALRKLGMGPESGSNDQADDANFAFVVNGQQDSRENTFGILEPAQNYPPGHPGVGGKKWYMVQRVNGNDREGDEGDDRDLDHKHTLEESDRIKKNSVQRWQLTRDKEKKKAAKAEAKKAGEDDNSSDNTGSIPASVPSSRFHATGFALQTLYSHSQPTNNQLTFYGSSFCPFAQRIWIALEHIGVPYQYIEVSEQHWDQTNSGGRRLNILELQDCNPEGKIPCIKHNNFAVWESLVMLEYLEDLGMGNSLFQPAVGNAQLKAHSRLWVDFINRRVLPVFYALLLLPDTDGGPSATDTTNSTLAQSVKPTPVVNIAGQHAHANPNSSKRTGLNDERYGMPLPTEHTYMPNPNTQCDISSLPARVIAHSTNHSPQYNVKLQTLINTLHSTITTLVNASHRTGPFFLGPTLSFVDITFAPFIIRLSRVLSYYRGFPRPEVGTRWQAWCDAIENNEVIRRTVSEERNYRDVYSVINSVRYDKKGKVDVEHAMRNKTYFPEIAYARSIVDMDGFGLGGDVWGKIGPPSDNDWVGRV